MARDRYGIKFTKATAKRIAESTRYVEQAPRNRAPRLGGPVEFAGAIMLVVTNDLNPMSGASPGSDGRGKVQYFDGTTYHDLIPGPDPDADPIEYPIINDTEKGVAIGAYVLCIPGPGGKFHMVTVDKCSNLT